MLAKIHTLPLEEQQVMKQEVRNYIRTLLQSASGRAFYQVRLLKHLSIEELANRLNISPYRLHLIESGDIVPTDQLTKQLSALFELDKPHDTNGHITLTYPEIYFASIQEITRADIQAQKQRYTG